MKVAIYTLGCKVNQYETQAMERELLRRGHELVPFDSAADAYVVNTCSVTAVSDKKSRQMLRRCRKLNPAAVVAACGCYVQTHPKEAQTLGLDLLAGTGGRMAFVEQLERTVRERTPQTLLDDPLCRRAFESLPAGGLAGRTRAMLKVEDGCTNFCAYCIIPFARGPVRSLPVEEAEAETRRLAAEGYRELVLTGIEISSYGRDLPDTPTLTDLVERICAAAGTMRVHLGSLEPRTVTEDFCRRMAKLPNLCPHFHLSLQSGCDATLKRMNRKYDTERFFQSVSLLRQVFDDPAVTTDLITGFPDETEEEFAATLAFIRRCGFADMHVFPYSVRPGTKAAAMPQLTSAVKERRAQSAAAAAEEMRRAYWRRWKGRTVLVLFEQNRQGYSVGHAMNYMEVSVPEGDYHNRVLPVRITGEDGERVIGEVLDR
ncbi:MAG: tRNA (N(6)-L-threonylcarbamoyladenosine(37)-C(2))-methylthiotransferase MtaB [Oscillospiraceae bacterium]|nr:tRNA (N(6)-L-threonylcarbamoyladenosine(37)-C(2))-methylthiotransferase MtaB [Oscillospiraceae bacterium]